MLAYGCNSQKSLTRWDCVPDPAPLGAYRGRVPPTDCMCPPNENCAPPSEDCAPKKLTGSGLLERKSRSKLVFKVDWHQILWRFWDEDLFFFFFWVFGRKNRLNLRFRPENPFDFLLLTMFVSSRLGWIFRAPEPLSNSHKINFSCPPKIYLCHPSHAILAPGLLRASDSRQIESAEESLSHWFTYTVRDSFKARLAGFEFAKANCAACQLLHLKQTSCGILKRNCMKPTQA